jgi:hypothetical protein
LSNARYTSKNDADEVVYVVSLSSSSGGYINGRNSASLELLIDTKGAKFNNNTTVATSGAGTAYPSGAPQFHPSF